MVNNNPKYIASLDVGTTTVRCFVFDEGAQVIGTSADQVELFYPKPGYVEIQPDKLWTVIVSVIKNAIRDAGLAPEQISCLGISTQRSSFTIWHSDTGEPFFNIITWRDTRADEMVRNWNNSLVFRTFKAAAKLIYYLTFNKRYLTGSALKMMNTQVTVRLLWTIENIPGVKEMIRANKAMFGTLDTWLLYRLTCGKTFATDYSSAACTGFFDPFTLKWADWAKWIFSVPQNILPQVRDTNSHFGCVDESVFGAAIPITCLVADQSAGMFGSCSFKSGDLKLTLGTGSFITVNTGSTPHSSVAGIYPLIGWSIDNEVTYMAEGASNDTGTVISWAQNVGLFKDPADTSELAKSVADTDGVYFIPSFSGIQAPINDGTAATGLIGIKPTTTKNHMVRAILESIVFRIDQLYQCVKKETSFNYNLMKVDGGVSRNDFIVQLLSDVTQLKVERADSVEMTVYGAAYIAGLGAGVWKSREQIESFRRIDQIFYPKINARVEYRKHIGTWEKAMMRFLKWYDNDGDDS